MYEYSYNLYSTYYDPLIEEELEIILSIFPASFGVNPAIWKDGKLYPTIYIKM